MWMKHQGKQEFECSECYAHVYVNILRTTEENE